MAAKTTKKTTAKTYRAKIRMYRQGLGDCFLITLPTKTSKPFYLLIDCGVILGTANPSAIMTRVVDDIAATTGGRIDVLAVTHEHWDHLSGFIQARESFSKLKVGEVWLAWTEDPADELANKLRGDRQRMQMALRLAETRMRLAAAGSAAFEVRQMLQFFGTSASTTSDALAAVRSMSPAIRFCRTNDAPAKLGTASVTAYVLGPPHDEKQIKKYAPSASAPETYSVDRADAYLAALEPALFDRDLEQPFDAPLQIPLEAARQLPFFQDHYWGEDIESDEKDQSWRAIDAAWLSSSSELALQLDSATNNTSLVLAIELDGGDVLLFAADAQVGNWLSWQDVKWESGVTGPDLLSRTIFYKTGHHGSHNATLREKGLEMMKKLRVAMVPVDHATAEKKGWDKMPLTSLMARLNEVAADGVVRIDGKLPAGLKKSVVETELYFELSV